MNRQELYNSRIFETYFKFIHSRYPGIDLHDLAQQSGIRLSEVYDQGHWFTQEQANRFHETAVTMTGCDQIAREAGRFAVSANALGVMRQYILSAVGPRRMFRMIEQLSSKLTRSSTYRCTQVSGNSVEIVVTPHPGVSEEPFQCENRMGFFESGVMIFNYNKPGIKHTECISRGAGACRYEINWDALPSTKWRKLRIHSTWILLLTSLVVCTTSPMTTATALLPISLAILTGLNFLAEHSKKAEIHDSLMQTGGITEKLVDQINVTYNNAMTVKEIGVALKHDSTTDDILKDVSAVLKKRLDFERCAILLVNNDRTQLKFRGGYGYSKMQLKVFASVLFHLNKPNSEDILVRCFRENRSMLINDLDAHQPRLSERSRSVAERLEVKSLICSPICVEGEPIGVLMMDTPRSRRPMAQLDLSMIEGVAPSVGTSLHNVNLLKEKEDQFETLLKVMSASIDARDSLTRGHSVKVTEYALDICRVMHLDDDFCEAVRVAALLHDYGKLAIPDDILKKPGKLTPSEYEQIKTHAQKTGAILRQINFKTTLSNVPEIAEAHHEKLDGSGYPYGLKGEDIPLGAKIIAVADIFEALTAERHYRTSLPVDTALNMIRKDVNTLYDQQVFEALEFSLQGNHSIN